MRKLTIYLEEASVRSLQRLAAARKCRQAEIVREVVSDYLRQYPRPQAKGAGMYSSGRSDISERAEELLRHAVRAKVSRRRNRDIL
jgi:hypothetical protein